MATIKIKQIKSRANRPIDQKRTLDSLGLTKMNKVVEHEDTAMIQNGRSKSGYIAMELMSGLEARTMLLK